MTMLRAFRRFLIEAALWAWDDCERSLRIPLAVAFVVLVIVNTTFP